MALVCSTAKMSHQLATAFCRGGSENTAGKTRFNHNSPHVSPPIPVDGDPRVIKKSVGAKQFTKETKIFLGCFFFFFKRGVLFPLLPATGLCCKRNPRPSAVGLCQSVTLPLTSASSLCRPIGEHSRRADVSHQLITVLK